MSNRPKVINRLTKAQILQGRNYTEEVHVDALDGEVLVRVLTSGEVEQIKAVPARGMSLSFEDLDAAQAEGAQADARLNMDMEQMFLSQSEARFMTVAWGLSTPGDEAWTVEDARSLGSEAVEQIAKEVWRISNVSEADLDALSSFRGK